VISATTARPWRSPSRAAMRPLVAQCHPGLAKLYRRAGDREHTHAHLTTAVAMFRELDMRFWLEQAGATTGPV